MGKVNDFINRKLAQSAGSVQERADRYINKIVPKMTAEQECRTALKLTRGFGVSSMRHEVLTGFAKEWSGQSPEYIDAEMQRYRNEPLFAAVMKRLYFSWEDVEKIAEDAKCVTPEA